jgi:pimeloyl-ACP methyl ester carboxylesterase
MKIVLVPGWNESSNDMRVFVDGRNGIPGLAAHGFDCIVFPEGGGGIRARIDRFAEFLADLKTKEPHAFPVATLGYSAGGLVNRGFLRAYPERAGDIASVFQIATPNGGLSEWYMAPTLRFIRFGSDAIDDMDVESPFMAWLNGAHGRYHPTGDPRRKRWELDGEPWVITPGMPLFHVVGRLPRHGLRGDGLVEVGPATLNGRIPHMFIDSNRTNHLNLGGEWNPLTFFFRGWRSDDTIWPTIVDVAARFFRGEVVAAS